MEQAEEARAAAEAGGSTGKPDDDDMSSFAGQLQDMQQNISRGRVSTVTVDRDTTLDHSTSHGRDERSLDRSAIILPVEAELSASKGLDGGRSNPSLDAMFATVRSRWPRHDHHYACFLVLRCF